MANYSLFYTDYGFSWGHCIVERTAARTAKPKFQVLTVIAPNGDRVEIMMSPKKLTVDVLKKQKPKVK